MEKEYVSKKKIRKNIFTFKELPNYINMLLKYLLLYIAKQNAVALLRYHFITFVTYFKL